MYTFSGLDKLGIDSKRSTFALLMGLIDFTAFFNADIDAFRHVSTGKALHVIKRIQSNTDMHMWCSFLPETNTYLAENLMLCILDKFELFNGPFSFDCIAEMSTVLSQILLDGKSQSSFNQTLRGVEYAPVDRQTFLEMYSNMSRFRRSMLQLGRVKVSDFALLFNDSLVVSSMTPEQIVRISTERAKMRQVFWPDKKFLVTAINGKFRFLFLFKSLPENEVLEIQLKKLFSSSEKSHARLEMHFSEISKPDTTK